MTGGRRERRPTRSVKRTGDATDGRVAADLLRELLDELGEAVFVVGSPELHEPLDEQVAREWLRRLHVR